MRDPGIDIKAIKQVMHHEFASMYTVGIPYSLYSKYGAAGDQLVDTATLRTTKTRKSQLKNKNNTISW